MAKRNKLKNVAIRMVPAPSLYSREQIREPKDVIRVLSRELEAYDREVMCVVNLRSDLSPINVNIVSIGIINASLVSSREIFKASVLSNAAQIMLVHNHPSGNPKPSQEDMLITEKIRRAAQIMDIPLVDHVIIGSDGLYFSFQANGLLTAEKKEGQKAADRKEGIMEAISQGRKEWHEHQPGHVGQLYRLKKRGPDSGVIDLLCNQLGIFYNRRLYKSEMRKIK